MDILISRGMFENGAKVRDHPGFFRTLVVMNTISIMKDMETEEVVPVAKKLKTGGLSCNQSV